MAIRSPMERALGTSAFLTLRGKCYQCSPLRMRHFAEAKAFLCAMAPDPVKELADDKETFATFPPEIQKHLAIEALRMREQRRTSTSAEAAQWINSEEGVLFLFWCMVRDHHKELATFNAVIETFTPGNEKKELSIPECDLIRQKIDEITLGSEQLVALAAKKKQNKERKKKLKKANR